MRKGNDEIYQLAKDQALVKKLKKIQRFRPVCLCPPNVMYEKDALACESTLCVAGGTHWMTLVDPKFISLTTIQVGKTKKRELLDPRVTNITSGGNKQKGLNLLFF